MANGGALPPSQPYADEAGDAAVVAARRGALEVRDVSFSYPARADAPVLRELTLMLPHGKVRGEGGNGGRHTPTCATQADPDAAEEGCTVYHHGFTLPTPPISPPLSTRGRNR